MVVRILGLALGLSLAPAPPPTPAPLQQEPAKPAAPEVPEQDATTAHAELVHSPPLPRPLEDASAVTPRVPPPPPAPRQPELVRARNGWMVGSFAMGALAWGATALQVVWLGGCSGELRSGEIGNTAFQCGIRQPWGRHLIGLHGFKAAANGGGWLFAAAAGITQARHEALDVARGDRYRRLPGAWISTGFVLSAAGLIGLAGSSIYVARPCSAGDCSHELRTYFITQQLSQSMFSAGLGMVTFGFSYNSALRHNEELLGRAKTVRLAPQLGPGGGGAAVSGRF